MNYLLKPLLLLATVLTIFSACQDQCADTICLNDGVCEEGICDCPAGFGGDDCSIRKTPTSFVIRKVIVHKFHYTPFAWGDNRSSWDVDGPADPFIAIFGNGENSISSSIKDAPADEDLVFNLKSGHRVTDINSRITIWLRDSDPIHDNMGNMYVDASLFSADTPASVRIGSFPNDPFEATIYMVWKFAD